MIPVSTIKAICRVTADAFRQGGTDPKTVAPEDAWKWYVEMVTDTAKLTHTWATYTKEDLDFLQLDGEGGQIFRREWTDMTLMELMEATDLWLPTH